MTTSITNIFKVRVNCMTFNHASYINDAMNGFCMQQTNFPFVCVIIDDASTDGEPEVIRNYLQEHFDLEDDSVVKNEETEDYIYCYARHKTNHNCFFAVYYLKYNHYNIKKPKAPYIKEWKLPIQYIALCEGDDYWIDSNKLQKQVVYMESHPDCTMTCSRAKLYSEKFHKYIGETYCYKKDCDVQVKDVIYRTGLFISTASIIYRTDLKDNYPDYCKKCAVGDYPLQIMCVMKGSVQYFNDAMVVYRVENSNSWCGQQDINKETNKRFNTILSEVNMFKGFAKDYPAYSDIFYIKIQHFICANYPTRNDSKKIQERYANLFKNDIYKMNLFWKFIFYLKRLDIPGVLTFFYPYTKRFAPHKTL